MPTIAELDENQRLVGYIKKKKPSEADIVVPDGCDLPTDGTYRWSVSDGAFFPVGRGFGKPKRPAIPDHKVLHLIAKSLGKNAPQEVRDWVEWYETNIERGA